MLLKHWADLGRKSQQLEGVALPFLLTPNRVSLELVRTVVLWTVGPGVQQL